jgi:hypothetical protein
MIRSLTGMVLAFLLLPGCGDRHHPSVRRAVEESEQKSTSPNETAGGFQEQVVPQQPAKASGPEVDLGAVKLTAPEGWVRKRPPIEFIRAEFSLPCAEGDPADGRLTVSVAGGSVQVNVDRWKQQFTGKIENESQEQLDVSGKAVTLVDYTGTYVEQRGMGPSTERPGYRMLGAIFDVDGQLHFIKAYGPAKTMAAHADEFRTFVRSLKTGAASQ